MHRSPALNLLTIPALTSSPTVSVDQILSKHVQALGGSAAIKALQTLRTTSTLRGLAPFDIPVVVEQTRAGLYRREVTIQGTIQITAFDGKAGWKIDPFGSGSTKPEALQGEELKDLQEQMDFDGDLVDVGAKGHTVVYEGLEKLPTGPAHKLHLTLQNGRQSTIFLDATCFLEVRRVQTRPQGGQEITLEIISSDYRVTRGVKIPFAVTLTPKGAAQGLSIRVDKVEVNAPLAQERFIRPA